MDSYTDCYETDRLRLSPYSKIRYARMGLYTEPETLTRRNRREILRKLMARRVDSFGNEVTSEGPVVKDNNVIFLPPNLSFSSGEESFHRSTSHEFDNLNETDYTSRSLSPIRDPTVLQEFSFKTPEIQCSTPIGRDIPPYMVNQSVQPSPQFLAKSDYCKENHWKILAFEFINMELIAMLQTYSSDIDLRIEYSPLVLMEMLWKVLSKMVQEIHRVENAAAASALNSSIRDVGAKVEIHNRRILEKLEKTERELLEQKQINAQDKEIIINLKSKVDELLVHVAFPAHKKTEQMNLAKLRSVQETLRIVNGELQIQRAENHKLEAKLAALNNQIAGVEADCAQDLAEAAQISLLGEEAIESAVSSYLEKATQCSPQVLSAQEWEAIGLEAVQNLKGIFEYNERYIRDVENDIVIQNKTLNNLEAERLKLKEKIYQLDMTLKTQKHMIKLYEEDLEPAGREIREWQEFAGEQFERPIAGREWSPTIPSRLNPFGPEGFSTPLPGDVAFREDPPVRRRLYYSPTSPPVVFKTPSRPPVRVSPLRPSPRVADPYPVTGSPVLVASPQYEAAVPIPGTPGAGVLPSPSRSFVYSPIADASLPSGISCLSSSSSDRSPTYLPDYSDIPSLFSPIDNSSGSPVAASREFFPAERSRLHRYRASTPVRGSPYAADNEDSEVLNGSVLLNSPYRSAPVQLDVAVQPQPLYQTQSGEHLVCNISLNMEDHA